MNDKPIRTETDLKEYIAELQEERERIRRLSEATAEEVYQISLADFHGEQGARRITELAEEHNISFAEALTKYGNYLHPTPPGLAGHGVGSGGELTEEQREERAELKRILGSRDLSGLTREQRESLSLEDQEFFTRPRDGQEEA